MVLRLPSPTTVNWTAMRDADERVRHLKSEESGLPLPADVRREVASFLDAHHDQSLAAHAYQFCLLFRSCSPFCTELKPVRPPPVSHELVPLVFFRRAGRGRIAARCLFGIVLNETKGQEQRGDVYRNWRVDGAVKWSNPYISTVDRETQFLGNVFAREPLAWNRIFGHALRAIPSAMGVHLITDSSACQLCAHAEATRVKALTDVPKVNPKQKPLRRKGRTAAAAAAAKQKAMKEILELGRQRKRVKLSLK